MVWVAVGVNGMDVVAPLVVVVVWVLVVVRGWVVIAPVVWVVVTVMMLAVFAPAVVASLALVLALENGGVGVA